MSKTLGQSRTSRRLGTKNAMHATCQRQTKRALRLGRKVHNGTGKAKRGPDSPPMWHVTNKGTKRSITVSALDETSARITAMSTYKLSKSLDKLIATRA